MHYELHIRGHVFRDTKISNLILVKDKLKQYDPILYKVIRSRANTRAVFPANKIRFTEDEFFEVIRLQARGWGMLEIAKKFQMHIDTLRDKIRPFRREVIKITKAKIKKHDTVDSSN
jgi:hypothetical protein